MPKLVENGHVYVARPPLFKVSHRKQVRYVQTPEEINGELLKRGLDGTKLSLMPSPTNAEARHLADQQLGDLLQVLADLESVLTILERRGLSLAAFFARTTAHGLPLYRVTLAGHEHWFHTAKEVDDFREAERKKLGHELVVADDTPGQPKTNGNGNGHATTFHVQELHEVRAVNRGLERLKAFGLGASDLVPQPRVAGREPPVRFVLETGEQKRSLPHLRDLPTEVRKLGERGLVITRFKGLGEMDGEELWQTTLDPEHRTLMQVKLDDVFKADEMFRTLMGEKVEPRREFIQKHALEVKEIDYHGA
jgi:DNA gyrase subunit B